MIKKRREDLEFETSKEADSKKNSNRSQDDDKSKKKNFSTGK